MTRPALSESERDLQRGRVLAAAEHLFAERGYEAVTMRALAAELGCSPMTPYRYFADKAEIFALVRASAFLRFAALQEEAAGGTASVTERLARLGRAYIDFAHKAPDAYRVIFALDQSGQDEYPTLAEAGVRAWGPLRALVGEAVAEQVLDGDPDTLAHLFWAGLHGIVTLHLAGKLVQGRRLDELAEPMLAMIKRGASRPEENQR